VPGTYSVRANASGFGRVARRDIAVGVGQIVRTDLALQLGTQNRTVLVEGTPPIMNTTGAMISTTLEIKAINELPLNGRLYTKLLDYTPGGAGRLFYFGNYEGFRYTVGAPGILQIPSSFSLGGDPPLS